MKIFIDIMSILKYFQNANEPLANLSEWTQKKEAVMYEITLRKNMAVQKLKTLKNKYVNRLFSDIISYRYRQIYHYCN